MKAAIYCRVSTNEQDVSKQEDLCTNYCKHKDPSIEIYKVYKDVMSGAATSRPAFDELLADMRLYRFRAIVVTKLDRIGRSLQHLLSIFDEFRTKHVDFIAVTQNIDTSTAAGKLQLHILSAFAEFERNIISERTKEGLRNAVNVGKRGKDKRQRKRRGCLRK